MEFWTDYLGGAMWVFDPSGIPPWRNLQTGVYTDKKPSGVNKQFTPSGPYSEQDAQLFPFADQHIPGFPSATGGRAVSPTPSSTRGTGASTTVGIDPAFRSRQLNGGGGGAPGEVPPLNPDDFYWKFDAASGDMIPARPGEKGAVFNDQWWADANKARADVASGFPTAGGRTGPTAAELAIERSKVDAQNLATFISGTIAELEIEVDSKRLSTEQALGEFNKRLDAFAEAGSQFQGIQPFTVTPGAKYLPGREPGGVGERLGRPVQEANPIQFDPFAMASQIVTESTNLEDIGAPGGDALSEAVKLARSFLGG